MLSALERRMLHDVILPPTSAALVPVEAVEEPFEGDTINIYMYIQNDEICSILLSVLHNWAWI